MELGCIQIHVKLIHVCFEILPSQIIPAVVWHWLDSSGENLQSLSTLSVPLHCTPWGRTWYFPLPNSERTETILDKQRHQQIHYCCRNAHTKVSGVSKSRAYYIYFRFLPAISTECEPPVAGAIFHSTFLYTVTPHQSNVSIITSRACKNTTPIPCISILQWINVFPILPISTCAYHCSHITGTVLCTYSVVPTFTQIPLTTTARHIVHMKW